MIIEQKTKDKMDLEAKHNGYKITDYVSFKKHKSRLLLYIILLVFVACFFFYIFGFVDAYNFYK